MSLAEVEAATETAQVGYEGGSLRRDAWRRLRRDPVALFGFGLIAVFILVAIFAPPLTVIVAKAGLAGSR